LQLLHNRTMVGKQAAATPHTPPKPSGRIAVIDGGAAGGDNARSLVKSGFQVQHLKPPATKQINFGQGKLGFMTEANKGSIKVVFVAKDGQADREGVNVGDTIMSINVDGQRQAVGNDNEKFYKTIRTLQQNGRSVAIELASSENQRADGPLKINEKNVLLEAGQAYKRVVQMEKGESIRVHFWITEPDMDIGFSLEEKGHKNLVLPLTKVWNKSKPAGPASFTAERDGKFTLVWDNSHSWLRSKHLNYYVEVLPAEATPDAIERLQGESQHLKGALKSVDNNLLAMEKKIDAEKANRAAIQKNFQEVQAKLQSAKSGAGAAGSKAKAAPKKEQTNENKAQNSTPNSNLAV